jgi:hypothetical protein
MGIPVIVLGGCLLATGGLWLDLALAFPDAGRNSSEIT